MRDAADARQPDLLQEPFGAERGGELGMQNLEGDLSVVPHIVREIDSRHAAPAKLALNAVAIVQGPGK